MKPKNKRRFNRTYNRDGSRNKVLANFPFPQDRFVTDRHPVVASDEPCRSSFKSVPVSHQELQMLEALAENLQQKQREAIRIALYELSRSSSKPLLLHLDCARAQSAQRGHTSRSKTLLVRLTATEKAEAQRVAEELGLSQQELVRFAIIWLRTGIRDGEINRLIQSPKISQEKRALATFAQLPKGQPSKLRKLKEAAAKAYAIAEENGRQQDEAEYEFYGSVLDRWRDEANPIVRQCFEEETGELNKHLINTFLHIEELDRISRLTPEERDIEILVKIDELTELWVAEGIPEDQARPEAEEAIRADYKEIPYSPGQPEPQQHLDWKQDQASNTEHKSFTPASWLSQKDPIDFEQQRIDQDAVRLIAQAEAQADLDQYLSDPLMWDDNDRGKPTANTEI